MTAGQERASPELLDTIRPEASTASSLAFAGSFGFSAGGVGCSSANQDALRMTFIRSIFFWRAMIP